MELDIELCLRIIGSKPTGGTLVVPIIGTSAAALTSTSKGGAALTGVWFGAMGAVSGGMVMAAM